MDRDSEQIPEIDGYYHVIRKAYNRSFMGIGKSYGEALMNMAMMMARHESKIGLL